MSTKPSTEQAGSDREFAALLSRPRLPHIDALRGVAVVFMILLHIADGWLRPGLKDGIGWQVIRTLGGQAAPLFLLLAGVGVGLGWASKPHGASWPERRALLYRGVEITLAGYALRLAMWWIDSGAIARPAGYLGGVALALGYAAAWRALASPKHGRVLLALAAALVAIGVRLIAHFEVTALHTLLRPDVLHTIGIAIALIALLEPLLRAHALVSIAAALAITLITTRVGEQLPAALPGWLAGYLAPFTQVPGGPPPGRFPLCPWLAHAFVGVALGRAWGRAAREGRGEEAAIEWAVLGAALALLCCESIPETASLLVREPQLTPTVRVAYRIGLSCVLGALCVLLASPRFVGQRSLLALGRASLFVYCAHLELAFGLLSQPMRKQLGYVEIVLGTLAVTALMTALSHAWLRVRHKAGPKRGPAAQDARNPLFSEHRSGLVTRNRF